MPPFEAVRFAPVPPRLKANWASEDKTPVAEVMTGPAVVNPERVMVPEEVRPVMFSKAPALVSLEVPAVLREPSDRSKSATWEAVEFKSVNVLVAAPVISMVLSPPAQVRVAGFMVKVSVVLSPIVVLPSTERSPVMVVVPIEVEPLRIKLLP